MQQARERARERKRAREVPHTLSQTSNFNRCTSYFSARPQKAAAQSTRCCMTDSRSVPLFTMCSSSHPDQAQFPGVGKAHGAWPSAMQSSMSHRGAWTCTQVQRRARTYHDCAANGGALAGSRASTRSSKVTPQHRLPQDGDTHRTGQASSVGIS